MAMAKRMPFAGYGDQAMGSPREPGAALTKRTAGSRPAMPMTGSGGGTPGGGGGGTAPRVPPPSPLPPDVDLSSLIEGGADAPMTPANVDDYTTTGMGGGPEGASSPISTVLQMILRGQGGRA